MLNAVNAGLTLPHGALPGGEVTQAVAELREQAEILAKHQEQLRDRLNCILLPPGPQSLREPEVTRTYESGLALELVEYAESIKRTNFCMAELLSRITL